MFRLSDTSISSASTIGRPLSSHEGRAHSVEPDAGAAVEREDVCWMCVLATALCGSCELVAKRGTNVRPWGTLWAHLSFCRLPALLQDPGACGLSLSTITMAVCVHVNAVWSRFRRLRSWLKLGIVESI